MSRMAKLSDVLAASEEMSSDASLEKRKAFRVVWSVTAEDAASTGSLYHATSVLLYARVQENGSLSKLVAAVRALVPDDVIPRSSDTVDTLVARLSQSEWLDDIHFPVGGHGRGGRTTRLNSTPWRQPRRHTCSVEIDPECSPGDGGEAGDSVKQYFAYTQARRNPRDWRCRGMPYPLFQFVVYLWDVARPFLGAISAASPPTAVQMTTQHIHTNS